MLGNQDYEAALGPSDGGGDPRDNAPTYTKTNDPNVMIGRYGVKITKDDLDQANKNGMAWQDLPAFADWLGGWAKKMPDFGNVSPYYRTYPQGKINGGDVALLMSKNDPQINTILQRNIAKPGEVPMFGAEDSDLLKKIIDNEHGKNADLRYIDLLKSAKQGDTTK